MDTLLPSVQDARTLAAHLGLEFVDVSTLQVPRAALQLLPAEFAARRLVLPVEDGGHALKLAVVDPFDPDTPRLVQFLTGRLVDIVLASRVQMQEAIERLYAVKPQPQELELPDLSHLADDDSTPDEGEVDPVAQGPIVQLVEYILSGAIRRKASDIHIRPNQAQVDVVYRIDGNLTFIRKLPKRINAALLRRIKVLGKMNVAESRLPQDGQISLKDSGGALDLRISVLPTIEGESAAIRILSRSSGQRSLDHAGLEPSDLRYLQESISRNGGMILVTGPTGSGKSTTLYAVLGAIAQRNVNIITVEDPVEYHIGGVQQIPIHAEIGMSFAAALRNILRHDPDVIMVGEIRDAETARIAVESALTGHLMLSTLHTNSAVATVDRLLEMGVEPFLLRSTLLAVLAQRLVRLNCPHCLVEEEVDLHTRALLDLEPHEVFRKGAGCPQCGGTGISGRRMTYELLRVTPALRALIARNADAESLQQQAVIDGMVPLTRHAISLARKGIISLGEAYLTRLV